MTTPASSTVVQRLWHYCNVLRDGDTSYGDLKSACRIAMPRQKSPPSSNIQ